MIKYKDFYTHLLTEAFGDEQKKKWLAANPTIDSKIVDQYIKWFDDLRKSKPAAAKTLNIDGIPSGEARFDISQYKDWKSFETFVDAVRGQTQLKGEKLSDNLEVIDAKPLFTANGLEVYYADTPRACIKYKGNAPYSWCVARPDSSNMFYSYRLRGSNPAFYFVKDVAATQKEFEHWKSEKFEGGFKNKWHFFVIQVLKDAEIDNVEDENYVVTSANNDGDVTMSWREIVSIEPKLKGLQDKFLPKPLSPEELEIINKYRNGITVDEFVKLPYNEKERFLDVYPAIGRPISDEMFDALPYELKNKYIGMNIGLSDDQYAGIQGDKNLLKRYVQMVDKKFEHWLKDTEEFKLEKSEYDVLSKYNILDKYTTKLTDDIIHNLVSNTPNRQQIINYLLINNIPINDNIITTLLHYSPNKQQTIDMVLNKNIPITGDTLGTLLYHSPNKQQTIDTLISKNVPLTDRNVYYLLKYSPNKQQMIDTLISKNVPLTHNNLDILIKYTLKYSSNVKQTLDTLLSKIDALKAKQQLKEKKFKYREFFI